MFSLLYFSICGILDLRFIWINSSSVLLLFFSSKVLVWMTEFWWNWLKYFIFGKCFIVCGLFHSKWWWDDCHSSFVIVLIQNKTFPSCHYKPVWLCFCTSPQNTRPQYFPLYGHKITGTILKMSCMLHRKAYNFTLYCNLTTKLNMINIM